MIPVLTPQEMQAVDERAQREVGLSILIERAGYAVAMQAIAMLAGAYGRRIVVVAGKGHNGDDGRVAARILSRRGARVLLVDATALPESLPLCDLVIDAAYGTGFRGDYAAPQVVSPTLVLAVDIPSGVDATTGAVAGTAVRADVTVTFGALKPGLLFHEGPAHCGKVLIVDIGLEVTAVNCFVVEDSDCWRITRRRDGHKWDAATLVVAGSPGMLGAAMLSSTAALRTGSGMVHLASPGTTPGRPLVSEAIQIDVEEGHYAPQLLKHLERCKALVIGPGLGTAAPTVSEVAEIVAASSVATLVDADGLNCLVQHGDWTQLTRPRHGATVLTPHDGEFARLNGAAVGTDRVAATRALAERSDATVLLKGSTTVVASNEGPTLLATAGSARLATAGTGDVLSGIIGALLARGIEPLWAAALGAHVHGRAASLGPVEGLVASDLPPLVAQWLSAVVGERQWS